MAHPKIATCCYCGTRQTLVVGGAVQHELKCSNCGAPLHEMKHMPIDGHADKHGVVKPSRVRVKPDDPFSGGKWDKKSQKKKKKPKKKKSFGAWFLDEVLDEVKDIFD